MAVSQSGLTNPNLKILDIARLAIEHKLRILAAFFGLYYGSADTCTLNHKGAAYGRHFGTRRSRS